MSVNRANDLAKRIGAEMAPGAFSDGSAPEKVPGRRFRSSRPTGSSSGCASSKTRMRSKCCAAGRNCSRPWPSTSSARSKPGVKEQEFAARIDWRIKSAGFERCSFETIVASGPNAALPHAHAGERVMRAGDLVVLDFGGVYGGYCVDLTRTVALGEPDAEMARVYGAVLEAQKARDRGRKTGGAGGRHRRGGPGHAWPA